MHSYDHFDIMDPKILRELLLEMDQDVAIRVVASAFSLSSKKIIDAFTLGCSEMEIRAYEQEKNNKNLSTKEPKNVDELVKSLRNALEPLIKNK